MTPENPPAYALRFSVYALRTINAAVVFLHSHCDKTGQPAEEYALAFRNGLYAALATLATLPTRFAVAPEAIYLETPLVRAMPYRQKPSSPVWRVLYRVHEADDNEAAWVEIVAIRHGAQKTMTRAEGRDVDAANR